MRMASPLGRTLHGSLAELDFEQDMGEIQYSASWTDAAANVRPRASFAVGGQAPAVRPPVSGEQVFDGQGLSKRYGDNLVLDSVDLCLAPGEAVAVIGENGAGKSTLAKIMAGVIQPDAGDLRLAGRPVNFHSPRDARRAGVGFIPQELAYFPDLTVAENIVVGRWPKRAGFVAPSALIRQAVAAQRRFGIELDMRRPMGTLKIGERQLVEIVKALSGDARVIILDEPTAALTDAESRNLFRVLGRLLEQGCAVLYISHRMDEVFRFSDRIDVLRNGRLVASAATRTATPAFLIAEMLGQAAKELAVSETAARLHEPPALAVRGWTKAGEPGLRDVTFHVARGEVVGLFGLRGSGAELVAEGLGGLHGDIQGATEIDGRTARRLSTPRDARRAAISYVPAERKRDGLVLSLPVQANLGLLVLRSLSRLGFLRGSLERRSARALTQRLGIRFRSLSQPARELSGGNQQKVMVGSRLATNPKLFVMHEPTRGVDVGARVELHGFLRQFASQGPGILIVTTDVEEAVSVTDRLLVLREGGVIGELSGPAKTQGRALALAAGEVG
jgi:ribose transport system ATP-binding protein